MAERMSFPKTLDEFMQQYKIVDTEKVYTNGAELIPIFRIEQWEDAHEPRKGKWELMYDRIGIHYICSCCGEWKYHQEQNYCGHCGADMREEKTDVGSEV